MNAVATGTYGTAHLRNNRWAIDAQPHVMIMLKRVFAGAAKKDAGKVIISATEDNCRKLEWFAELFPLEFNPDSFLREMATAQRERASLVDDLLSRRAEIPPFELAVPAREYQKEAAALVLATGGLLLADDVGIGKTAAAICTFCDTRTLPALVVTLTHLPQQWRDEIKKFAPHLRTHIIRNGPMYDLSAIPCHLKGGKRHVPHVVRETIGNGRKCLRCGAPEEEVSARVPDVIITSYSKLAKWDDTLAPVVRSVIYDEVQELRHGGSDRYIAAKCISDQVDFRLGLSATPIYNYGGEMYNVIEVLRPTALGDREEFSREWSGSASLDEKIRIIDPKAFGAFLRESGIMLRRTRADVGRELPPVTKIPHYIDADVGVLDEIGGAAAELAKTILKQDAGRTERFLASGEFDAMMRRATGVAKAPFVAGFVEMLLQSEQRIVLYGWHHEVYRIWQQQLAAFQPVMYTGKEDAKKKEEAKRAFCEGESRLLIISLRAGAGLDGLQHACRTVVFGELDWSPGVHEQCEGRLARDGQQDPVACYYLIAESGSDPVVADVLGVKGQQIRGLRDEQDLVEKLEVDEHHVRRLAEAYLAQRGGQP